VNPTRAAGLGAAASLVIGFAITAHTQALRAHPAGYERRVITLFDEVLLRSDG
jgi:hypothetical protein